MPQLEVTRSPLGSVSLEMRTHLVSSQQLLHGKWARRADTMASSLFGRLWALLVWFLWTSGPIYLYPCTPCTMVTQPNPRLKDYTFWLLIAGSLPESDMFPIEHGLSQPGLSRSPLTLKERSYTISTLLTLKT